MNRFAVPHRRKALHLEVLPATFTDPDALLVPVKSNNPTWDALSTDGLFNFTVAGRHNFIQKGLEDGRKILSIQTGEKVNFYWMVPFNNFHAGNFRIGNSKSFVWQQAEHFLIPRLEPSIAELNLIRRSQVANMFRQIIDGSFSGLPPGFPTPSEALKEVIGQSIVSVHPDPDPDPNPSSSLST